jgi:hypothetical protein
LLIAVATCSDGVKNGCETGVDCGGCCGRRMKCADGMGCNHAYDCSSSVCTSNVCQGKCVFTWHVNYLSFSITVPTCNDGIRNANETDVDCGGWCDPTKRCHFGYGCHNDNDCISNCCFFGYFCL